MTDEENDSDLDSVPRRRNDPNTQLGQDGDLSPGLTYILLITGDTGEVKTQK